MQTLIENVASHLPFVTLITLTLVALTPVAASADVTSTFDTDDEGWTQTPTGGTVVWANNDGNPGGYLRFEELEAGRPFVIAPPKFLGDWSGRNGCGEVRFDHIIFQAGSGEITFQDYEIQLTGGSGETAQWTATNDGTTAQWRMLVAPLKAGSWTISGGSWESLLTSVVDFRIRIELVSNTEGSDFEGIDNAIVADCDVPAMSTRFSLGLIAALLLTTLILARNLKRGDGSQSRPENSHEREMDYPARFRAP